MLYGATGIGYDCICDDFLKRIDFFRRLTQDIKLFFPAKFVYKNRINDPLDKSEEILNVNLNMTENLVHLEKFSNIIVFLGEATDNQGLTLYFLKCALPGRKY